MKTFTVADYLLQRLQEAGIAHLFGVPGDYNLEFLDHVIDHPEITWVGCANELNAAYAADGYGRSHGAAALLTTFGVGELSAINGVAGSYAEYVPVLHIVGAPATEVQQRGDCVHHSLGDGDFQHFHRMAREVSVAHAVVTAKHAAQEIDHVMTQMLRQRRPGYLQLAVDVARTPIDPPRQPLFTAAVSDEKALAAFANAAERLLAPARNVALLADFLADRWQVAAQLATLRQIRPIPCATLLMGKGVLDEQQPGYLGTYAAAASDSRIQAAIEQADVTLLVGVRFTDTLTAGFTQQFTPGGLIELQPEHAKVAGEVFASIAMADALRMLEKLFRQYGRHWQAGLSSLPPTEVEEGGAITQRNFWRMLQRYLKPGDLIVADQGTAAFGAAVLQLPEKAQLMVQPLWGSIGYTLPAAFGALTADPERRLILVIGDGSAQLTIQELGSMQRDGQRPVILLLNNDGYSVERAIHGPTQRYNDISSWNWTALPHALSQTCQAQSWCVTEAVQLEEVLLRLSQPDVLSLVEVVLAKEDIPPLLRKVTDALHQRNSC
ncbi:alpha-keto acid decarboxylase family protein [Pantoea sp. A4]|uniref:alpha-keto acid decarboxylase family protein n=1 Tax=Pantoea sp. A4 TaxID=1225184 RepID=UPI000362454D|nr:thiamine pyrophosphate-binding protein [Pantoea sp. A4]